MPHWVNVLRLFTFYFASICYQAKLIIAKNLSEKNGSKNNFSF